MSFSEPISRAITLLNQASREIWPSEESQKQAVVLAAYLLEEANNCKTREERKTERKIAKMLADPKGKALAASLTDECFRTNDEARMVDQIVYLLKRYGIPKFYPPLMRFEILLLKWFGCLAPRVFAPLIKRKLAKEVSKVIIPAEPAPFNAHLRKRQNEGIDLNINHLGEAILGEQEASRRTQMYMDDLLNTSIDYVSIKISTIYSQIHLLAWEESLAALKIRLRLLYKAAMQANQDPALKRKKFVNLDMEEYRDLYLTVALFKEVLDEPEFMQFSAGIALQAYIPDSYIVQQDLTAWALRRVAKGGAPIKIRLVKGANLAMEQIEAAYHLWPQAPYTHKEAVDANYIRMLEYGCQPAHAQAVHIGVGSHNLFDIAYALILRASGKLEQAINFEMLEGMADNMRRAVQQVSRDMLLYCPAAYADEFQNAVAYLIRRLDENTAPGNFLRQMFDLTSSSPAWKEQAEAFKRSCLHKEYYSAKPRRQQNRALPDCSKEGQDFSNEPDTDWTSADNSRWMQNILNDWHQKENIAIPLQIAGKELQHKPFMQHPSPCYPQKIAYHYSLATLQDVEHALQAAYHYLGNPATAAQRVSLLKAIAAELRRQRGSLIGAMVYDTAKTVAEADSEVSEAIDFAEYYAVQLSEYTKHTDIQWQPKGIVLITPPWNFPCSIPAGGMLAAIAGGNACLFKPAPESILVGWELAQIFWKAGTDKQQLQFIIADDDVIGTHLIKDPRINTVVLTGGTGTAKLMLNMRPGIDLIAETGGKNAIIVSNLADRDLAIKDILQSAFSHAGQKCSACSLAILHKELYNDQTFLQQLKDAASSLIVGLPWSLTTRINPLIHSPNPALYRALTSLEPGETWLIAPKQHAEHPNLWSPGIKLGVSPGSFTHQTELFGPLLGIMCAENLENALELANSTPYGLTSGLHSLDEREQQLWSQRIVAGNCYINRGITGAIVQRQPFGGTKQSSFGPGIKAGGPNYLFQFMHAIQVAKPETDSSAPKKITTFGQLPLSEPEHQELAAAMLSYSHYWETYFSKSHDQSKVLGQDNFLSYTPHPLTTIRMDANTDRLALLKTLAAAVICQAPLYISGNTPLFNELSQLMQNGLIRWVEESEEDYSAKVASGGHLRIRCLAPCPEALLKIYAQAGCSLLMNPVLDNGRFELLHYLREVSLSRDYHRYGYLGIREEEQRTPLISNY